MQTEKLLKTTKFYFVLHRSSKYVISFIERRVLHKYLYSIKTEKSRKYAVSRKYGIFLKLRITGLEPARSPTGT